MQLYLCEHITRREDAYILLAYAVRRRWGMEHLPVIARGEKGKPCFPDYPDCHFNLSHSGTLALCALDEHPIGADIEAVRSHHSRLAQRICAPEELAWLERQTDQTSALCQLWTRKEALVKYHGIGLTVPLRTIHVPLPPVGELDGLRFHAIVTRTWCACVCGHTASLPLIHVPVDEILV